MVEATPVSENRVDTSDSRLPVESPRDSEGPAVLVIAGLGNSDKVERHLGPLAAVASETTVVCVRAGPEVEGITYREAPTFGEVPGLRRVPGFGRVLGVDERVAGIVMMLFLALAETLRGDYDAVVSISLVPYGYFALIVGKTARLPTHLGIIGADLDLHATAWYGSLVRAAFRRFTAISVPGNDHLRRLVRMGVAPDRISILANAVDADRYRPGAGYRPEAGLGPAGQDASAGQMEDSPEYDILWVGRFSPEKDPLLFVRALGELADHGVTFEAAMVGSGSLETNVHQERAAHGLIDRLDLPGWVDDPLPYYGCSSTFALTSEREGLPLSLLEAMAVGVAPVVPDIGSVTDVAVDGETALVVDERTPEAFADALERLLADDAFRAKIADKTPTIRASYSYAAARDDWRHILATMGCLDRRPSRLENGQVD